MIYEMLFIIWDTPTIVLMAISILLTGFYRQTIIVFYVFEIFMALLEY